MTQFTLVINGKQTKIDTQPENPLLYVLRDQVELAGPRFGCGLAQCGACTVLVEGEPTRSCVTAISDVDGQAITTLEGLGTTDRPSALQQAFIDEQAAQCGYCLNGVIMTAQALLKDNPKPTDDEIREGLADVICRCGTHGRIVRAIARAARQGVSAQ